MKTQKLLVIAAIVCLLVGASGVAMAQETCEERYIENVTIDEDVIIVGQNCRLQNVTVNGDVRVVNSEKFTIQNGNINGNVVVEGSGEVDLNDFNAAGYRVVVKGSENVEVSLVEARRIRVTGNNVAYVFANAANTFRCKNNTRLVAGKNQGPNADQECDTLGL